MKLVIDANVLFAALIKDGVSAELLFHEQLRLYAPEFIFVEMQKHQEEILRKTHRSLEEFERLLQILKRRIIIVLIDELRPHLDLAMKISPDLGDVAYIALALLLDIPIWSNDKPLKEQQDAVIVYNTAELLTLLTLR